MRSKSYTMILLLIVILLIPQFYMRLTDGLNDYYSHKESAIRYPVLPLIESEISRLRPVISPALTTETLDNICALALGKKSTEEVVKELREKKIDTEAIRLDEGPRSLLVNNNRSGQNMLCAAYIINLPYRFPPLVVTNKNINTYSDKSPDGEAKEKNAMINVDSKKLTRELQIRLAVLQVNSEYFSQLAKSLTGKQGRNLDEYRNEIRKQFVKTNPEYLKKVKPE